MNELRTPDVAIIGGGISGIGAAIDLHRRGLGTPLILERSSEFGGTWRDNTYPGCACDIPSALYSYSFAPNPEWSRVFAGQDEIRRYVLDVVDRFEVHRHASLATEVLEARWDDASNHWDITTTTGPVRASHLVIAAGPLNEPVMPDVPGIDAFNGDSFHSARWRHDIDLTGRRVAVIGSGASAGQFVPLIQPQVDSMVVIQRTPAWVMPKPDRRVSRPERWVFRRLPIAQRLVRDAIWRGIDAMLVATRFPGLIRRFVHPIAIWNIARAIDDPILVEALTPDYVLGCKRTLMSNTYYPALAEDNVTLVPHGLREVRANSVVDAAGNEHEVDTIIYATGFHVQDLPIATRIIGADGRSLAAVWNGEPRAYRGSSIAGFPNATMIFGPNIGTANAFTMLDAQLGYLRRQLETMRDLGLDRVDVRADAQQQWNDKVHDRLAGTVWTAGGCASYYLDAGGSNASAWPWTMRAMHRGLRRFPVEDYVTAPAMTRSPVPQ